MDRSSRRFLIVCLVAFSASFVLQGFVQWLGAEKSLWGGNPGWQREIAFWNVAAVLIAYRALLLKNEQLTDTVVQGFTVLFLLLGTNHLFAFIAAPKAQFHWPPLVANYIGFIFGVRLLLSQRQKRALQPKPGA